MRSQHLLLTAVALAACGGTPAPQPEFDAAKALARIEAQVAFGPRIPGTAGHREMAAWLDSLARMGSDSVVLQRWTHVSVSGDSLALLNVMARFNPAARNRLLYLAHWDTRPRADSPTSSDSAAPVPGANDGGSGVAVLLGVMDALRHSPLPPDAGVDLLFVDGEDYGDFGPPEVDVLIGSRYYAGHAIPPARPDFAVLWDMVGGRDARFRKEEYSMIAAPDVVARVWRVAEQMGYGSVFMDSDLGAIKDDHLPLINAGIRAIDVIGWGDPHWHTPNDTPDKISTETLAAAGNVAIGVIRLWAAER